MFSLVQAYTTKFYTPHAGHCVGFDEQRNRLVAGRKSVDFNSNLFSELRFSMYRRLLIVDFSPQFPFWHPRSPNTFATSPGALSRQPPTRQSYLKRKKKSLINRLGKVRGEIADATEGNQYPFTCILFCHPTLPPWVYVGRKIDRSSVEWADQLPPRPPSLFVQRLPGDAGIGYRKRNRKKERKRRANCNKAID